MRRATRDMETGAVYPFTVVGDNRRGFLDNMQCIHLFPGMVMSNFDFFAPIAGTAEVHINEPILEFSFHLSGRGRGELSHGRKRAREVSVGPAVSIVSYNPETSCRLEFKGGEKFRVINIYMPPRMLGRFLGDDVRGVPDNLKKVAGGGTAQPFNYKDDFDPAIGMITDQILNCPYRGAVRKLYLESKALELLACRLARFNTTSRLQSGRTRLSPGDVDRLHEARDRLLANIDNPPSLENLARRVGINTTKLKRGFQQVFGESVFSLLRKERISRARRTLESRGMNITEIAHHYGYSDASHFIREFTRFYGTTPGAYLKTRG